jgi:CheY-like chemotaxis protein
MASTILVVDDDPIQCGLLGAMLRRFGYEARIAESGEQGFAALRRA